MTGTFDLKRFENEARKLISTGEFDAEWYQSTYLDVQMLDMDPAEHFAQYGFFLGRSPNANAPRQERKAISTTTHTESDPVTTSSCSPAELAQLYADHAITTDQIIEFDQLVSIIIPSFNNATYLGSAINSALSQTGVNIEVIVVDDGSDDTSVNVAAKARQKDDRVRVIPLLRNFGCYYARNTGVAHARGDFICFLDSDDIMHPERVLRQMRALRDAPSAMACHAQCRRWSVDFQVPFSDRKHGENGLFLHRNVFDQIGFFDTVQYAADTEFRLRIQRAFQDPIVRIDDELCFLRTLDNSLAMSAESTMFQYDANELKVELPLSRKIYEQNFTFWQKNNRGDPESLYMPFPLRTRLFDLYNSSHNASPSLGEKIIGKMATYPPRESILKKALHTILPQLDRLVIYLNDYEAVPDFLKHEKIEVILSKDAEGDLRDNGKFYKLPDLQGYIFTLDDDIAYPSDYVRKMIHYIEMFQRNCVIGVHGVIYPLEKQGYMENRTVFLFTDKNLGAFVDSIGTGTAAFHSSTLDLNLSHFKTTGICDLWFARACHSQGVPLLAIPREKHWMQEIEGTRNSPRLFDEAREQTNKHTKLYHENLYPVLCRHKPSLRASEALLRLKGKTTLDLLDIQVPKDSPRPIEIHETNAVPALVQYKTQGPSANPEAGYVNMHVIVNGWNCKDFVKPCLRSLVNQKPGHYIADFTLIDDGSTDGTFEELTSCGLLPTARIIRNTENYGPAYSRHVGITQIIDPQTVVVLVDLDDELKPDALKVVAERYLDNPDCLLTIGNWVSQRRTNPHPFYSAQTLDDQCVRDVDEFYATHLRTFRRKLYNAINVDDLQEPGGAWLQTCTDVAIMFPLLDQCYARNVEFIEEPIYFYNERHGLSTLDRFGKPYKRERLEWIRQKPRKPRFEDKS